MNSQTNITAQAQYVDAFHKSSN